MIAFPNAKINLGLNIIRKRPDGFHDLETVFYPVSLCDALEIIKTPKKPTALDLSGLGISGNVKNNLCFRAYELLKNDFDLEEVKIHLHKVIPMGAGLGGGSSDAAQTLILLNKLFNLELSQTQLLNYASKLGADCSFFILNRPVFAYERGDKFKEVNLKLEGYHLVIIKPEIHINTSDAFAEAEIGTKKDLLLKNISLPITEWKEAVKNDFEKNIFEKYPEIAQIKNELYKNGAVYASMSGSGSAVYALFNEPVDLPKRFKNCFNFFLKI